MRFEIRAARFFSFQVIDHHGNDRGHAEHKRANNGRCRGNADEQAKRVQRVNEVRGIDQRWIWIA